MGEEVEITTKSPSRLPSRSAPLCPPRIPASVSIPPDVIRHLPHPLRSTPLCPSPHLGTCFYSAGCYPASPPLCASLPHPCASHKTNNPAISDRAASFSSSVLFAGDGVCGTVIDISGLAAKPDTRADYRLRHHLCLFYYWLLIHLFHNNYCLLC